MKNHDKKFYVYELRDPAGVVFYVGKGSNNRLNVHKSPSTIAGGKTHLYNKLRKFSSQGLHHKAVKVFETDLEDEAFKEEIRLIAFYGRDNLCNHTDGGEGPSGFTPSAETIERRARANRGKKRTDATKRLMSQIFKGREVPQEWRDNMSAAQKGKTLSESTKEKLRQIMLERSQDPAWIEKVSRAAKGRKMSEESRLKVSLARRGKKLSEEHKAKLSAAHKGRVVSEKTRQILRDAYTGNQWTKRKIALADDKRPAVGSAISAMPDCDDEPSFE